MKVLSSEMMSPALEKFVQGIEQIIQAETDEHIITKQVAALMESFLQDESAIPENMKQPNPNKYTLYPLYIDSGNRFSIASAVWDVGQATPIHDHQTWGVIGIVQGAENEVHFSIPAVGKQPEQLEKRVLKTGDVAICCMTDQDIHQVSCASSVPCVGLHVYGANIGEIKRYMYDAKTGERKEAVTAWDPIPQ